jgi:hypothetical protein
MASNEQLVQSILSGMQRLMQREEIHESFNEQLQEIDTLVWELVEETE